MRLLPAFASTLLIAALTGCAGAPVPVNYAPSSVLSASGSLQVGDFAYLPAEAAPKDPETKRVAPNQIRNTAMGDILIDREVKTFVRDGVFAELRFVGIKMADPRRVLSGRIEDFLVDDLGFNVDWSLRVAYEVVDPGTKAVLYKSVKSTSRRTAKGPNAFGALNETVKLSAEELVKDPEFLKVIQ